MEKAQIGVVGMEVMGKNLALNIEDKGYRVAVFNRTGAKTERFIENEASGKNFIPSYKIEDFVNSLEIPRKVWLMVKAGFGTDAMIGQISPCLSEGDIMIDGGNSHFKDTERREEELKEKGILYVGSGVSGGEEGARYGPCLMPGGASAAYDQLETIFKKVAAVADDGTVCVTYIGERGAGHFVKTTHNGIEYAIMESISEVYNVLKNALKMSPEEMRGVMAEWEDEKLGGYLMEITVDGLGIIDPDTGNPLIDLILDKAGQKGTGKWTSQSAADLGEPVPTIDAALSARFMSAKKEERVKASKIVKGPSETYDGDKDIIIKSLRDALYGSMIVSYAQGLALLRAASIEYDYKLDLREIANIWKGGCIIRSKLLFPIVEAFERNPDLTNLLFDPEFSKVIGDWGLQTNLRLAVKTALDLGIPVPALQASLTYVDSYRSAFLPANMIQLQRDIFGAHGFKRVDKEGDFHIPK